MSKKKSLIFSDEYTFNPMNSFQENPRMQSDIYSSPSEVKQRYFNDNEKFKTSKQVATEKKYEEDMTGWTGRAGKRKKTRRHRKKTRRHRKKTRRHRKK